jgi:glycosyltransferase involved in cell wall biosynthesis
MAQRSIVYAYPQWHTVSFTLVAKKHIEQLRKYTKVYEWDETTIPDIYVTTPFVLIIHPVFGAVWRWLQHISGIEPSLDSALDSLSGRLHKFEKIVGFEVADSDAVSELAVKLLAPVDEVCVPSEWSRRSFINSGCKKPVHVVPHGLDTEWYTTPPVQPSEIGNQALQMLYRYKLDYGKKLLTFWLWHSPERKGYPEVQQFYEKLRKERDDVALVIKTQGSLNLDVQLASRLNIVNVWGWLDDREKMLLYDLSDITLLFSRGGAFEINGLESLARGVPIIAHRKGPWAEYSPEWCLVPEALRVKVFVDNAVHTGYGYTVDVEKAVDLAHAMLDNLDEYKARTREYAQRVLAEKYTWEKVGAQIWDIVSR